MYYIRVLFAVIGGVLTGGLNIRGELGLVVGITIFLVTYILFRNVLFTEIQDKSKYYKTAIFSYFLMWFVMWVLSINIIYPVLP